MPKGVFYIVGAGDRDGLDFAPGPEDRLAAVDGGLTYARDMGLTPDIVIGDFDSLPEPPTGPGVIVLSREKDHTDTFAAIQHGVAMGYKTFHIHGGTGGRLDHTLANLQALAFLSQMGLKSLLFGETFIITAVTNGELWLDPRPEGYVSVFSHTETSVGVSITGLKYPLENALLTNAFPLGVSNEFMGGPGVISVEKGTLIIMYPRK